MSFLRDCVNSCSWENILDLISNSCAHVFALVDICCCIAKWVLFLVYFISYAEKDITGYEYYDNKVFIFQGNKPRERISDSDCKYADQEAGKLIIKNYEYSPRYLLITFGSIWLFIAIIFIGYLIYYEIRKINKKKINKQRKIYFNGLKLIFDFFFPLIMIPIFQIQVNEHCVTDFPDVYFWFNQPSQIIRFWCTMAVILVGYFIAIYRRWPLYTMFFALARCIFQNNSKCCKILLVLFGYTSFAIFGDQVIGFSLLNPLVFVILSLFSFILTLVSLFIECEQIIVINDLHSALFQEFRKKQKQQSSSTKIDEDLQNKELHSQKGNFLKCLEKESPFHHKTEQIFMEIKKVNTIEDFVFVDFPNQKLNQGDQQKYYKKFINFGESFEQFYLDMEKIQEEIRKNPRCCWCVDRFIFSNQAKDARLNVLIQSFRILFLLLDLQKSNLIGSHELIISQLKEKLDLFKKYRKQFCNSKWLFFWQLRNLKVDTQIKELTEIIEQEEKKIISKIDIEIE